jgi:RNase P/RNase MRP subunit p30
MTFFIDLNIGNKSLEEQARAMGYSKVFSARVSRAREFQGTKRGELVSVESDSLSELEQVCVRKGFFLVNPVNARGFHKSDFLPRLCAENGKAIEIPLLALLHSQGRERALLLYRMRSFLRKCNSRKALVVLTSRALDSLGLKRPKEVIAIAEQLGLKPEEAKELISGNCERVMELAGIQ